MGTYEDGLAQLRAHPARAVVLAAVAQIHEPILVDCSPRDLAVMVWALDVARRWALGAASAHESYAASWAAFDCADKGFVSRYSLSRRDKPFWYANAAANLVYSARSALGFPPGGTTATYVLCALDSIPAEPRSPRVRVMPVQFRSFADLSRVQEVLIDSLGPPGKWGPVRRLERNGLEVVIAGDYRWAREHELDYKRVTGLIDGPCGVLMDELLEGA